MFVDNRYVSPDQWFDGHGKPFQPQVHYFVGGATKFYGAALYRLRERDFGELKHHDGISPAWPIEYAEMEPYYTQAEQLYQVHGARGEDPTEPPSSRRRTLPARLPRAAHPAAVRRHGRHRSAPVPLPLRVMLDEADPADSACIRCATCDGFACLVHAKSDADVIAVRPAILHDNVTLVRNAVVAGWRPRSRDGRVSRHRRGRRCRAAIHRRHRRRLGRGGELREDPAGQRERQASPGLANGSDQVGRNYVFHNSRAFLAVSTEKNDTRFQKTLGLNDYYFGDADFDYPMGNLQMVGKSSAPMYRGEKPIETALAPTFALHDVAERAIDFWLSVEDLPDPDNRVTLDRDGNVVLAYTPNNTEPMEQLYRRVKRNLRHLGMHPHHLIPRSIYMKNDIPVAGCAHQAGTVRFGKDPGSSVLDTDCKAHELDNLYVVDTSFFPSIGAVNPALTAMANALRVGDHLAARLR